LVPISLLVIHETVPGRTAELSSFLVPSVKLLFGLFLHKFT